MALCRTWKTARASRCRAMYKSFGWLTNTIAALPVKSAVIDPEIVCLDSDGKSVFLDLMRKRKSEAILYCFDLALVGRSRCTKSDVD
jgi:ATP-dependent DNA ligase